MEETTAVRALKKSWPKRFIENITPVATAMLEDAALFLLGVFILAVSYFCLLGLQSLHYPAEHIQILEKLHFWGFCAALFVLVLDLILKLGIHAFSGKHKK